MKSLACTHACPSPPLSRHSGLTDLALERAELVPRCRDLRLHRLNFEWAWKPSVLYGYFSFRVGHFWKARGSLVEMFGKKPICTAYPRRHEISIGMPNFEMPNLDSVNFCTTVKP